MSIFLHFLAIFLCMTAEAFFAGMETGVISIHRIRLRHAVRQGSGAAKILQQMLENSDRLFGTTLVGTNICMVTVSILSASVAVPLLGGWGEVVSTAGVAITLLIFCEYLPKAWFHSRPLERCRPFARLLHFFELLFKPISSCIVWLTRFLVPGPAKTFSKPDPFVTKEDLKVLVREVEKGGDLSPRGRVMIHRVFELSGKHAAQIMTPREKMNFVEDTSTVEDFLKTVRQTGFTRTPVLNRETNRFVGILNVFSVLAVQLEVESKKKVTALMRPPLFVSEHMPVDDILPFLRRSGHPMCLVQDDRREVLGLVTTEDILEEIVGEL